MLAPFAPHITEELWSRYGYQSSVHKQSWPKVDPEALVQNTIEIVLQINGKVRDKIVIPAEISRNELETLALSQEKVKKYTNGHKIVKVIAVPGKLVNIVIQ